MHTNIPFIKMDDESYKKLSSYITQKYGIKLPPTKKSMLEGRLNKKVRELGFSSYKVFVDYLFSSDGKRKELSNIIDLVTTNKTDFFREPVHFQFLTQNFLPGYVREYKYKNIKIWSVACSTGEEPYTILMALEEFKKQHAGLSYSIFASDISLRAIQSAHQGIYHKSRIENIPNGLKRTYFLQSNDKESNLVRIKPAYRKMVVYKRINLLDDPYMMMKGLDIIFCRNVLIYFDKQAQEKVITKLASHLRPGGMLFLGHSESLMGMDVPLKQIRPTVYQSVYGNH